MSTSTPDPVITGKLERLTQARQALAEKNLSLFFYVPDTQGVPAGSIIEIYQLVATYRAAGYEAKILVQEQAYAIPRYLDEDLQGLPHVAVDGDALLVKPEDIVVIPEYFTTVMAQTAKLACQRVVLVQGYENAIIRMIPGTTWKQLGITHVWTMSEPLTAWVKEVVGQGHKVQTLRIGIPDYFAPSPVKDPVVAVQVRNASDLVKISNEFYLRYPELRWVGFEPLSGTEPTGVSRRQYAQAMRKAAVVLWVDRIAAFGQTAVEAMATQTPLVALIPDHNPEYITDTNAVWVTRLPEIATKLGQALKAQLDSAVPAWLTEGMAETAAQYTPAKAVEVAVSVLQETIRLRDEELQDLIFYYEGKLLPSTE